jgi:hypothetical protein
MSESIKELSAAMAKAFGEITGADKDKEVKTNTMRYKYATLSSIVDAIKPAITKYGIWFYQQIHTVQGCAAVETVIVHSSGESLHCGIVSVPLAKNDAQGYGSGLTYAKKYSLSSAFGVAPEDEDDDGEAACAPPKKHEPVPNVLVKKPVQAIEDPTVRVNLINELVAVTKIDDPLFMERLDKIEKYCTSEGKSFNDELRKSIASPEDTVARFNEYKARYGLNKSVKSA